ncbi:hypothetical protein GCM10027517_36060 [Phycicoccus ginsengisoli]
MQVAGRVGTDLVAVPDRDDAEVGLVVARDEVLQHRDVPGLEDLQGELGTGHQHRAEREQREPRHGYTVSGPGRRRHRGLGGY